MILLYTVYMRLHIATINECPNGSSYQVFQEYNMYKFGEKHPIIFEIILIVAAFAAAAVFTTVGNMYNLHPDLSTSVGRIVIAVVLLLIYKRAFERNHFFTNPVIVLPALLFVAWNFFYYLSSGSTIGGINFFIEGCITALAPALFEEVLFRGIFIYNLKKKEITDLQCLFITAIVFSATHLTNLAGMNLASVAVQTLYSFVIGLVLAAIYLRNGSLLQVIVIHFLIDFSNRIFVEQPASASYLQLTIFGLVLVAETIYAVKLTSSKPADDSQTL